MLTLKVGSLLRAGEMVVSQQFSSTKSDKDRPLVALVISSFLGVNKETGGNKAK